MAWRAGASHDLVKHLGKLAARPGHQLVYPAGRAPGEREKAALRLVPGHAWQIAIDGRDEVRERRAGGACVRIPPACTGPAGPKKRTSPS